MRKTAITLVVLAALGLGWAAWPFVALYEIARAAQAGDAGKIGQRVDFQALRRSLADQVLAAYAQVSGVPLQRGFVGAVAGAAIDPFIAKLVTPEALAELLRNGWPKAALGAEPPDVAAPSLDDLGNILRLYVRSDYGIGEFRIALPLDVPAERRFRLELALSNWTWKLAALDLPVSLTERLARELAKTNSQ